MKHAGWYAALLSVAAPLILLGGAIGFVLLPRVLAGRGTLDEERGRFFEVAEEIRGLASLRQTLSRISPGALEALFIPKDRPLAFVEALETLALRSGTSMEIVFLDSSSLRSSSAVPLRAPASSLRSSAVPLRAPASSALRSSAGAPRPARPPRPEASEENPSSEAASGESPADAKKASQAPKQSVLEERAFEVRLRGPFEGAMRFLAALERQPALLRVDGVTIQAIQERGQALPRMTTVIRFYAPTLE